MKFSIEQIALFPSDPVAAIELLKALGMEDWAHDHVVANGQVRGKDARNEADLAFNYSGLEKARELEVLSYTRGNHWMATRPRSMSHLGTHCTAEELVEWRAFFKARDIVVAQEVMTESHTNPIIAGRRTYNYVIFDTRPILGIDLKFIVRQDV